MTFFAPEVDKHKFEKAHNTYVEEVGYWVRLRDKYAGIEKYTVDFKQSETEILRAYPITTEGVFIEKSVFECMPYDVHEYIEVYICVRHSVYTLTEGLNIP